MEDKYTGKSYELNKAKSNGMSNKAKKFLASVLVAGNLIAVGTPTAAREYTNEELDTHNRYAQELENQYRNMYEKTSVTLSQALKNGEITVEQYNTYIKNLQEGQNKGKKYAIELQSKTQNIFDKNTIFMNTLRAKEGDTKSRVELNLNDISSLNKEQIEYLEKKYHIDSIVLNRYYELDKGEAGDSLFKYSPETYKQMLDVMDKKFGDLKNNKNLTDLEKATIVLKRMENIKYDYDALNTTVDDSNINSKDSKVNTARNMVDPLFNKSGICAGYSDLFKNTMSYLNIESKEIRGYVKGAETQNNLPGNPNHAWNQVKLDGNWYNVDITEINQRNNLLNPNEPHPYVFVSDKEFNDSRSADLPTNRQPLLGLHENAPKSISQEEIDKALNKALAYEQKKSKSTKTSKNSRENFLSFLSNNGKYKNLTPTQTTTQTQQSHNINKSIEQEDNERV